MDIGCRFYTPVEISEDIANHAGEYDLIVDLFSGVGNLYKAFFRKGYANRALAFDINPAVFPEIDSNGQVTNKLVDCLNPIEIRKELNGHSGVAAIILNPPFKRIPISQELLYWKKFSNYHPKYCTQRIECIAIAAAISAAPKDSVLYVIIPDIVKESKQASIFFNALKKNFSLTVVKNYKRARFSSAEVDVVVIQLRKHSNECITKIIERIERRNGCNRIVLNNDFSNNIGFTLFRGRVRSENDRKTQISVKDLKKGGISIVGNKNELALKKLNEINYSIAGDILLARVGQRTIGRVGIIIDDCVLTNESILTLRISNERVRMIVYSELKSTSFIDWCERKARGTANYFITKKDFNKYILTIVNAINNTK